MKTPECQQLPLVEALRDGRLGPQEQASMERHLSVCATCTAFAHDLDRIGAAIRAPHEPVTPLQHQRARLGLLRRAAELSGGEQHAAPRRFPVFAFAAALSFAAAIGWASARIGAPEEQPLRALHQQLTPQLPALLQTSVHPAGGTRYERSTSAEVDTVTLTSGALDVNVRPLLPSERFVVKTTDAEVEVRGTSFHIVADQGRIKSVTVVEGQAEVRYAGFSAVIPAGGSWKSTGDEHASNDAAPKAPDPPKPAEPPAVEPPAIEPPSRPRSPPHPPCAAAAPWPSAPLRLSSAIARAGTCRRSRPSRPPRPSRPHRSRAPHRRRRPRCPRPRASSPTR
ncbi:MAG: FecR domain-containing protein [Byssovorax sp.]